MHIAIKVTTMKNMDDFCYAKEAIMWYHQIDTFCYQQRWMEHKGGHWYFTNVHELNNFIFSLLTCDAGIFLLQFLHTLGVLGHSSVCSCKYHYITHYTTLPHYTPVVQWRTSSCHNPYTLLVDEDTSSSVLLVLIATLVHHIQGSYTMLWQTGNRPSVSVDLNI